MRKLATIQTIDNLEPIDGADSIVKATCLGWHVVVKKDEFKIGDKCIYIEIDSIVPKDNPVFEFLEGRKYRVRTIKLRKQISQGLCLPIELFPSIANKAVGTDVTEELKIVKYDPEIQSEKTSVSAKKPFIVKFLLRFAWFRKAYAFFSDQTKGFPSSIISKSDEERIQSVPSILTKYKGIKVSYTEKVDGQSYTATLRKRKVQLPFCSKYEFVIASRNLRVGLNAKNNYTDVTERYNIFNILKNNIGNYKSIALQGEICGPGIQKNKYGFDKNHLFVFRVRFNTFADESITLNQKETENFAKLNNLETVPYLGEFELNHSVDDLVKLSSSEMSKLNSNTKREGIVIREAKNNYSFSFKVINPEFLLKYDE